MKDSGKHCSILYWVADIDLSIYLSSEIDSCSGVGRRLFPPQVEVRKGDEGKIASLISI